MGPVFESEHKKEFLVSGKYRYIRVYGVFTLNGQREKSELILYASSLETQSQSQD